MAARSLLLPLSLLLTVLSAVLPGRSASAAPLPGTQVQIIPLASGLSFPIGATHAGDGSGRLFLVEQLGTIRIWNGTQLLATPFLNLSSLVGPCPDPVNGCGERGLLGLAFHPEYETNGFFYVFYTRNSALSSEDGDIVVARYQNPEPADNVAAPGSGTVLLTIEHTAAGNHNGGQIAFGPDGYLYLGTGDGGGGGDPNDNALNIDSRLGKILRIDVDGDDFPGDATRNYAIPPTNPFAGGTPGADEIWAIGLRNPWRFGFDRLTGDLFIGDVGQNDWEEVNLQRASSTGGENYGWDVLEGRHCHENVPAGSCNTFLNGGSDLPILEYNHVDPVVNQPIHCSVTGGFVSRSLPSHSLFGDYIYADICSGYIWRGTETSPGAWTSQRIFDTSLSISSFGESESGRLYVVNIGGNLHWLAPYTFGDVPPTHWAWPFVEAIYGAEITAGCSAGSPPGFCPGNPVTRAQMAVFLLKAIHGSSYQPPPAQGGVFDDVQPGDFAADWIEQLFAEGITGGCQTSPRRYCPSDSVSRAEMAIFLLRARHGAAYTPPATTSSFADVPNNHFAQDWIEQLHAEGLTGGCGTNPLRYCPDNPVLRAEMAAFLAQTLSLPLP
ncbi:MAG TPA: PQQ-dependent sugar dehydrogenase [Thermoanaerobaculia bacterium]|nr:PQQ-dependent sugar dehydrogenase [Thermoanaerobaculia bacterium]